MPEAAWPFLIGRTRNEDYRFVVIPAFMTDVPMAVALLSGTGGDPGEPGSALLREIEAPHEPPVTVVYRVRVARAEDVGVPGTETLTDAVGRPVLLTEGLVLRRHAASVLESGVAQAALDRAHDLVVPAFQRFWVQDRDFTRQVAQPFAMAGRPGPPLRLELAGPAVQADAAARHAPVPAGIPVHPGGGRHAAARAASSPGSGVHGRRRPAAAILIVATLLAALVLAGATVLIVALGRNSPGASTNGTIAGQASLSGRVPFAGHALTVEAVRAGKVIAMAGITRSGGRFDFHLPAGNYQLTLMIAGIPSRYGDLGCTTTVTLPAGQTVHPTLQCTWH